MMIGLGAKPSAHIEGPSDAEVLTYEAKQGI